MTVVGCYYKEEESSPFRSESFDADGCLKKVVLICIQRKNKFKGQPSQNFISLIELRTFEHIHPKFLSKSMLKYVKHAATNFLNGECFSQKNVIETNMECLALELGNDFYGDHFVLIKARTLLV